MLLMQARAAKIFLFFLEPQPLFPDNVATAGCVLAPQAVP